MSPKVTAYELYLCGDTGSYVEDLIGWDTIRVRNTWPEVSFYEEAL